MPRIVAVRALARYKVWVKFQDGREGTSDLSDLAGKGVFAKWKNPRFFKSVFVDKESGTIAWPGGIDISPESLYEEITGVNPIKTVHA